MRISDRVYLALSGESGCSLSHPNDCNSYAVHCGDQVVLIDAGVGIDSQALIGNLARDGVPPGEISTLLLTHAHLDHAGGARDIHDALGVPVMASERTAAALEAGDEQAISLAAAKKAGIYDEAIQFRSCPVSRKLTEGESLAVGDCIVQVIGTPGHSDDSTTYLFHTPSAVLAFVGDAVFHGGRIILQDTYDCRPAEYAATLRKLAALPIDALFPGHGIWSLNGGASQIRKSLPYLDRLLLPPNAL